MIINKEVTDNITKKFFGFTFKDIGKSYGKLEIYFCIGINGVANYHLEKNEKKMFTIPTFKALATEMNVEWRTIEKIIEKNKDVLGIKKVGENEKEYLKKSFNTHHFHFIIDEQKELFRISNMGYKVWHWTGWKYFKTKSYINFLKKKWKWPEWEIKEYLKNNVPNYEKK